MKIGTGIPRRIEEVSFRGQGDRKRMCNLIGTKLGKRSGKHTGMNNVSARSMR